MLPKSGTSERDLLDKEALLMGEKFLDETDGEIAQTLYLTYMHFRTKFLDERGLMDSTPDINPLQWDEALADALAMREYVDKTWAARILA